VWQAPSRAYGTIVGYDVMFLGAGGGEGNVVTKNRDELFHRVERSNLPAGGGGDTLFQVQLIMYSDN
jgi:hypothetical protein